VAKDTNWANRRLLQYGSTLAIVVGASVWRDVMVRTLGDTLPLYITFYPAVVTVSLVFGLRQGLLAIPYSLLLVAYWNLPREGTRILDLADVVGMVLFAAMGAGMAAMAGAYRRTRDEAADYPSTLAASLYARSLIEASMDPLVIISREGQIADVNLATESVTGVPRGRLIGSDFCDYFSEPEKARAAYRQVFADGLVHDYPLVIRHASGRLTDVLYNATVFCNQAGEVEGAFATARDVTKQKQAESETKHYMQELERSNAELQDFATIASHDLQEPLRKVMAFGEHLKEHSGDNLDELGRDYLARMQSAALRMSVLIEALLQYSRVATRAQPFQPVDLLAVVFGVVADMEERIAKSHARIELVPVPKVMADPTQMRQLMQNLVANALKFQNPGTRPVVVIEGRTTDQGWCEISVRDNGIGFEEKHLERIFRPFQRLHGRSEYEGSGMGLAICRKVVARHGGTITAHSSPGEGSTFVVTLPAVKITDGERRELWETETEPSPSESCSPKTMTTIST
jgi:PAS domain S-box-containing protein